MHRASILVFACAAMLLADGAVAQSYPQRPIHIMVPFSAGGGADIVAREIGSRLSAAAGQRVIVDNRPGAGGTIGVAAVARGPADGYLILIGSTGPMVINPALDSKLPYDTLRDFAPITLVLTQPMALVVHPSLPVHTVADLVKFAKARPGELNYGSAGVGNATHLAAERFETLTGVEMVNVPYKGLGPAITDLVGGHVHLVFSSLPVMLTHIRSGRLRPLAVGAPQRMELLPSLPTMAEAGVPGFDVSSWYGMFAPAGTPRPVVEKLNAELVKILRSREFRNMLAKRGANSEGNSVEEFVTHIKAELARWQKIVLSAGLKPK